MSSFCAPPGHFSQTLAAVVIQALGINLSISPPDADLKDAVLTTDSGRTEGTAAICRQLCAAAGKAGEDFYGARDANDKWLDMAEKLGAASASWIAPTSAKATDEERKADQERLEGLLGQLEAEGGCGGAGAGGVCVGEAAVACAVLPLFTSVIGADVRAASYPRIVQWLATMGRVPALAGRTEEAAFSKGSRWEVQGVAVADKKAKKKAKKGDGAAAGEAGDADGDDAGKPDGASAKEKDPEKAAKAAAKKAEKEAKRARALAKAAAKAAEAETDTKKDDKKKKEKEEKARKRAEEEAAEAALIERARGTPKGAKKDVTMEAPKGYHPKFVEAGWYDWWSECGFFKPDLDSDKPPFVIVIPPPNVTGALHIGHALTNAIEDTVVRWKRMSGFNTLWVPGTDHAGIATQTVVEKMLKKETGKTRHDLGREAFVAKVWEWKEEYGGKILTQLRRLGSSVDWTREAFTMDANLSRAVQEAFIRLHSEGLIYRDNRLVNWCCQLRTAVSDIEVDYVDVPGRTLMSIPGYDAPVEFGVLTKFAYQLEDGSGEVVIATTRPETMLGDTAVAVHPEDPRYKALHGKFLVHPVLGRKMPVICDAELVDMAFGTGAVKITPAHDPNDFATGKRHGLEFINILDDEGRMNANCGPFAGLKRFECRKKVVDFMRDKGLFRGTEDNAMAIPLCSRSKDVIEPILKPQWWVDCKDMAAGAAQAVRDGRLEIVPREYEATWFRWLDNIRDWCISRQLWWGHRIPAYYVQVEGEDRGGAGMPSEDMRNWVVARSEEEALARAQADNPGKAVRVVQDEDVLDTWFSSGLFPFSVFQWPEQTRDLAKFYPTTLLETGHDILFFWVARMVMMGMKLTGEVPFRQVYLHSMVRDAHGRKMSKTLGNVIDPIHVIEGISLEDLHKTLLTGNLDAKEVKTAMQGQKEDFPDGIGECGTDALRFALVAYTSQARDINLDIKRVQAYRNWCNKLWNALKFVMLNIGPGFVPAEHFDPRSMPLACRWVLHNLNQTVAVTVNAMETYAFSAATDALYSFWQYKLCDVFIELTKPAMAGGDATEMAHFRQALWTCLDTGLRLLHPFMPFVTEELWQRLPKPPSEKAPSIMVAEYPQARPGWEDAQAEAEVAVVLAVAAKVRSLRADYNLAPKAQPKLTLRCADEARAATLRAATREVATLSLSGEVEVIPASADVPTGCGVAVVDDAVTAHLHLRGMVDLEQELAKLEKKREAASKRAEQMERRMGDPGYKNNTPEDIQEKDAEQLRTQRGELEQIEVAIQSMRALALQV